MKELTQSWSLAAGTLEGKRGSEAAPDSQISALWERGGGHPTSFSPLKSWLRDGQSAGPHPPEDLVGLSLSLPLGGTSRLTSKLAVSAFWLVLLSPMTCQNQESGFAWNLLVGEHLRRYPCRCNVDLLAMEFSGNRCGGRRSLGSRGARSLIF